ncbi:MAG: substrate-binding domain-containing protein [Acidobacteriota bacterium]
MISRSILLVAICVALMVMVTDLALAQEVVVGAGTAPTENILNRIRKPFEKATGIKLTVVTKSAHFIIIDLDKGLIEAGIVAMAFNDWLDLTEQKGYKIPNRSIYKYRVVGRDRIVIVTSKDTGVAKLSKDELKGIFTGKILNWKEVGGKDIPITIVWSEDIPGTNAVFIQQILDGESVANSAKKITGMAPDIKKRIISTPGSISIGPTSIIDSAVFAPETPVIGRPMTVLTKGEPSPSLQKLIDFIRSEGQKYIIR